MAITPMDIHNKDFQRSFRGFDMDEVDDFLTSVQRELEKVLREKRSLEDELEVAGGKLQNYEDMQEALNKSIVVAQDAADRLRENADHEVSVIRKEAENYSHEVRRNADEYATQTKRQADEEAKELLAQALDKAKAIENETEQLRKHGRIFRQRLQLLIESQLDLLENEEWDNVLQGANLTPPDTHMIEEVEKELGRSQEDSDENIEEYPEAVSEEEYSAQTAEFEEEESHTSEEIDQSEQSQDESAVNNPEESDYSVSIEFPDEFE